MDSYPEEFAGALKRLAEKARLWTDAQTKGNGDEADAQFGEISAFKGELEGLGVLGEEACQQLLDLAVSASAVALCRHLDMEGLEEREGDFQAACEPVPEEVSEKLWKRTQKLFLTGARLECAEAKQDAKEVDRLERLYDRIGRNLAGLGKVGQDGPRDLDDFNQKARDLIPATVIMFSGCQDCQTSADVYNTASFGLPADAGPGGAGGACTNSMLKALCEEDGYTWVSLLTRMRQILDGEYSQIPMLSSSVQMDLNSEFNVKNPNPSGRFRALLVGINYVGSSCELRGCHNDVESMRRYIEDHGYSGDDVRILMDDGDHQEPTLANIVAGFKWLVDGASEGDSLFFHYSGHGASVRDDDGDEEDGKDEALVPLDYQSVGLLEDDQTFKYLVAPLQNGTHLTCVLDCCHSGTILDLPYVFKASDGNLEAVSSGEVSSMQPNPSFDFGKIMQVLKDHPGLCAAAGCVGAVAYFAAGPETKKVMQNSIMQVLQSDDPMGALFSAGMNMAKSFFG